MLDVKAQNEIRRPKILGAIGAPLAALDGDGLSARFHVWRTSKGARITCTILPADGEELATWLEEAGTAIVIGVDIDRFGLRRMRAVLGPRDSAPLNASAFNRLRVSEWHIHLLAGSEAAACMLADELRTTMAPLAA